MKTDITVVVDRSGSMYGIKSDMEGGFNTFLAKQREVPGECNITLVTFNDTRTKVYSKPLSEATNLTIEPHGNTALLDALGYTIAETGNRLRDLAPKDRPEKVLFLVVTDGQENASKEFTRTKIKEMIEHQTSKYAWDFVYLGANQDAFTEGHSFGIRTTTNYMPTKGSIKELWGNVSAGSATYRSSTSHSFNIPSNIK